MAQNIYDNPAFFEGYAQLPRSVQGLDGAPEWPVLKSMLPELTGKSVIDLGCGYGWFCRAARELGASDVTGVDISEKMLARAVELTADPQIHYQRSDLESLKLNENSLDLVYSSLALHYLPDVAPLFATVYQALTPGGGLAIVGRDWTNPPELAARVRPLFRRYSANRDYQPFDLVQELEQRGLFRPLGEQTLPPSPWRPTIDDYIESRHSQNGLSRERMTPQAAAAFDTAVRQAILDTWREGYVGLCDGRLALEVESNIVWGRPLG